MATITVSPDPVPVDEKATITVRLDPVDGRTITFSQPLVDQHGQEWIESRTLTAVGELPDFGGASVDWGTLVRTDDGSDPLLAMYEWSRPQ